ncbi:MAG TPA: glycosyltransferase family 39 protein [Candidatus Krumholzibacteria bacterium]|nr:glycosyltransferase family 39 protein [Candidatus Krumholzibacteria bacterium]
MIPRLSRAPRGIAVTGAILLVALAVRCWDLNARSLWFDEAGEYWVATAPFPALAQAVRTGTGDPPLYSFLLHAWLAAGSSALWIRTLSVIASLAGVAGVMALAHRLAGRRAALAAGILMAVLPADVRYAQEAGQYALMMAAVAWNLVALHRLWTAPSSRAGVLWATTALAASCAYYGAVIAIAIPFACAAVEALARRDRVRMRAGLAGFVVYAAGVVPLVLFFLTEQMARVAATDVSSAGPLPRDAMSAITTGLSQVIAFQFTGWPYTRVPALIPIGAALLLLGLAARTQRRALAWLAATWVVHALADVAGVFPYGFRWGLILAPLLVASLACGLAAAPTGWRRNVVSAAVAILALASLVSLPNRSLRDALYRDAAWPWPETEDMRAVLAHWRTNRTDNEPTYVYYGAVPAFAYYTRDEAWAGDLRAAWFLDCWHRGGAGCSGAGVHFGRWLRDMNDTQRVADVFRSFDGRPASFWIVFSHIQRNDDRDLVANLVANGYRIESAYQSTGAAIFFMTRT